MYSKNQLDEVSSVKRFLELLVRFVASWIDQRERQTERAHLTILFEKYVPRCLEQMRNSFRTITPIPDISVVQVQNTHACAVINIYNILCICEYDYSVK